MRAHGFGDTYCTSANDYVKQYVLNYQPRRARYAGPNSPPCILDRLLMWSFTEGLPHLPGKPAEPVHRHRPVH